MKTSACTGGAILTMESSGAKQAHAIEAMPDVSEHQFDGEPLNLSPARWLWYPSERCLQNTFILFRHEFRLDSLPKQATGWIFADSRYLLTVNGKRVQWGPAPCDPRWQEADPLDLSRALVKGTNVIAVQALYYGQGDGTYPLGKPGFIFSLDIDSNRKIVSDSGWKAHLAKSWQPGHYKRWYLRALQEEFDARLYPYGWTGKNFKPNADWLPAMELDNPADEPTICSRYSEYLLEIGGDRDASSLRRRQIPFMNEEEISAMKMAESCWIDWIRPVDEYFQFLPPNAYKIDPASSAAQTSADEWSVQMDGERAAALTFEFKEQIVGWPYFTIEAPAGTTIELMVHEGHEAGKHALLNTHYHSWSRFVCKEGLNRFETFDYETARWIQLHIHSAEGEVKVRGVGMRRRVFPWPQTPRVECSDPDIQRVLNATINTLHNCAQDSIVDCMSRERQQYSGDVGHVLHAVHLACGDARLPKQHAGRLLHGLLARLRPAGARDGTPTLPDQMGADPRPRHRP